MSEEEKPLPIAIYMGVYGGRHIVWFTESKLYPVGTALYLQPPKPKPTVYLTKDEEEPNWWENIPEHGILVKDKEDPQNIVLWLQNFCQTDDFYPLTNEEIERFKR